MGQVYFAQVMLLAAVSDGKIDDVEDRLIQTYLNLFPPLRDISEVEFREQKHSLINALSSGIDLVSLIDDIGRKLSEDEKNTAYALAVEVCSVNFRLVTHETEFLSALARQWKIKKSIVSAVEVSTKLRYREIQS